MAEVLEKALDISLDKKDQKRRLDRRREREAKRSVEKGNQKSRPDKVSRDEEREPSRPRYETTSRRAPATSVSSLGEKERAAPHERTKTETAAGQLHVVLHWPEELERILPAN